jgi:hypothetical protein
LFDLEREGIERRRGILPTSVKRGPEKGDHCGCASSSFASIVGVVDEPRYWLECGISGMYICKHASLKVKIALRIKALVMLFRPGNSYCRVLLEDQVNKDKRYLSWIDCLTVFETLALLKKLY